MSDEPKPEFPIDGMTVVPAYYDHPAWDIIFGPAWMGLIRFASGEGKAIDAFLAETGVDASFLMGRSPINTIFDQATGRERAVFTKFADWVTSTQWGLLGCENEDSENSNE